jgi:hypothetical protein
MCEQQRYRFRQRCLCFRLMGTNLYHIGEGGILRRVFAEEQEEEMLVEATNLHNTTHQEITTITPRLVGGSLNLFMRRLQLSLPFYPTAG